MRSLRGLDRPLLGLILLVLLAGLIVLYAASAKVAAGAQGASGHLLLRRLVQIALGLAFLGVAALADPRWIRRAAFPAAVASAALLLWVLGAPMIKGTRGWIFVGGFTIQPVDAARVGLLVFMADRLALREAMPGWRRFLPAAIALAAGVLLVALQPDFGSALALGLSGACVLIAARPPWRWLALAALAGVLMVGALYLGSDRIRQRVDLTLHFDASENSAENYQLRQSLIGIGAGGGFGQGAGRNRQRIFLPDHHTDFIFAIVGEEYGFFGASVLLALLAALSLRVLGIAGRQADPFARYLAAGVGGMLFVYTAMNVAVTLGLFPLTGVPLPFVSHGGSALVMHLLALGLVLSVSRTEAGRPVQAARRSLIPRRRRLEPVAEDLFSRAGRRGAEPPLKRARRAAGR